MGLTKIMFCTPQEGTEICPPPSCVLQVSWKEGQGENGALDCTYLGFQTWGELSPETCHCVIESIDGGWKWVLFEICKSCGSCIGRCLEHQDCNNLRSHLVQRLLQRKPMREINTKQQCWASDMSEHVHFRDVGTCKCPREKLKGNN